MRIIRLARRLTSSDDHNTIGPPKKASERVRLRPGVNKKRPGLKQFNIFISLYHRNMSLDSEYSDNFELLFICDRQFRENV